MEEDLVKIERNLKLKDKGGDVKIIQLALRFLGYYNGQITGNFDEDTDWAVREFQYDTKLREHKKGGKAIVGPDTMKEINKALNNLLLEIAICADVKTQKALFHLIDKFYDLLKKVEDKLCKDQKKEFEDLKKVMAKLLLKKLEKDLCKYKKAVHEINIEKFIASLEGLKLKVYKDQGGKDTIGVGHLITNAERKSGSITINGVKVPYKNGLTRQQALDLLAEDLKRFKEAVRNTISVELNPCQFATLVSFAFNVGIYAFKKSTLVKLLNKGRYDRVPNELRRWNKVKGKVSQGLVNRREKEIKLWNKCTKKD